jgi:hypothetical protein
MSTEVAVRDQAVPALVEEPAVLASRAPDPQAAIKFASECASLLKGVLLKQRLITRISGNDHVQAEGWTLLAAMTGYSPRVAWSRKVDPSIGDGWEACVELVDAYDRVVSAAEAMALRDEGAKWSRQEYSVRSMAQTRATSRAIRLKLGYIVTMAGYSATAAEEMPTESAPSAPGGAVAAPPARGRTGAAPAPGPQRSSSPSGSAGVAGSAMEVSHPEHRLHELWRILDALGIEWKPANYMRAIEVLKREGIENVDALRDDLTHARAKALVRIAFGVKLEPEGEPAEAVLNPPDFPAAVNDHPAEGLHAKSFTQETDGTVTAMYAIPSAKEKPGEHWRAHLSNGGGHICECPARKVPCRHITEALELLREDAERDGWVMRRFAVLLGLEEPAEDGEPAPETTGDAA